MIHKLIRVIFLFQIASVMLVDTKDSEDYVINFMLVENGFATYLIDKSPAPSDYVSHN